MKFYIAGPFFNKEQIERNEELTDAVEFFKDFKTFVPKRDNLLESGNKHKLEACEGVFKRNVDEIEECDVIIADITDVDSGTLFEVGYAYKTGTPIILFKKGSNKVNLMLSNIGPIISSIDEMYEVLRGITIVGTAQIPVYKNYQREKVMEIE